MQWLSLGGLTWSVRVWCPDSYLKPTYRGELQTNRQVIKQTYKQTNIKRITTTNQPTGAQKYKQNTNIHTYRQTDRHIQTTRHRHTERHKPEEDYYTPIKLFSFSEVRFVRWDYEIGWVKKEISIQKTKETPRRLVLADNMIRGFNIF